MPRKHSSNHRGRIPFNATYNRCVLIARSHTLLKDHAAALALYERGHTYLTKIPSSLGSFPEKDIPVEKEDVSTLATVLEGEMTRSHAHVVLSQSTFTESEYLQKVLLARTMLI